MLVLTRRVGEAIVIGESIRVTIASIQGNSVRLGITAPNSVVVDRQEVHEQRLRGLEPLRGRGAASNGASSHSS